MRLDQSWKLTLRHSRRCDARLSTLTNLNEINGSDLKIDNFNITRLYVTVVTLGSEDCSSPVSGTPWPGKTPQLPLSTVHIVCTTDSRVIFVPR